MPPRVKAPPSWQLTGLAPKVDVGLARLELTFHLHGDVHPTRGQEAVARALLDPLFTARASACPEAAACRAARASLEGLRRELEPAEARVTRLEHDLDEAPELLEGDELTRRLVELEGKLDKAREKAGALRRAAERQEAACEAARAAACEALRLCGQEAWREAMDEANRRRQEACARIAGLPGLQEALGEALKVEDLPLAVRGYADPDRQAAAYLDARGQEPAAEAQAAGPPAREPAAQD